MCFLTQQTAKVQPADQQLHLIQPAVQKASTSNNLSTIVQDIQASVN
jgi:hypothetical protein